MTKSRLVVPKWLSKEARVHFKYLANLLTSMDAFTPAEVPMLEVASNAYVEWQDAQKEVDEYGATFRTITDNLADTIKLNPAQRVVEQASKRYITCLKELGLTPASRKNRQSAGIADEFFG